MRKILSLLFMLFIIAGCTTTQKGAGIGTIIGAGAGAIIGNQSGNRDKGAAIGAILGGASGAAVGNKMERKKFNPRTGKIFPGHMNFDPDTGEELKWVQE